MQISPPTWVLHSPGHPGAGGYQGSWPGVAADAGPGCPPSQTGSEKQELGPGVHSCPHFIGFRPGSAGPDCSRIGVAFVGKDTDLPREEVQRPGKVPPPAEPAREACGPTSGSELAESWTPPAHREAEARPGSRAGR